jgi:hypothetical protein
MEPPVTTATFPSNLKLMASSSHGIKIQTSFNPLPARTKGGEKHKPAGFT